MALLLGMPNVRGISKVFRLTMGIKQADERMNLSCHTQNVVKYAFFSYNVDFSKMYFIFSLTLFFPSSVPYHYRNNPT